MLSRTISCIVILLISWQIVFAQHFEFLILHNITEKPLENVSITHNKRSLLSDIKGKVTIDNAFLGDSILITCLGFDEVRYTIREQVDTVFLTPNTLLEDVTITASKGRQEAIMVNSITINPAMLDRVPSLLGEKDLLKVYQIMPGVLPSVEGTNGLNIRGGSADQNLILMDGAAVYNPSHLFGLFSSFIPETIESAQLIKGAFPAQYAGRLSSVIDIQSKSKIDSTFRHLSVGLISSKFVYQTEIPKYKTHINFGYRRTYADQLVKGLNSIGVFSPPVSQFYNFRDFTLNLYHELNKKSSLSFNTLSTRDKFSLTFSGKPSENLSSFYGVSWRNAAYSAHYKQAFGDHSVLTTSLIYAGYKLGFDQSIISDTRDEVNYKSTISESSGKIDWSTKIKNFTLSVGGQGTVMSFSPGTYTVKRKVGTTENNLSVGQEDVRTKQANFYQNISANVGKIGILNLGLNTLIFPIKNSSSIYPQPRLDLTLGKGNMSMTLAYSRMAQTIQLLSYEGLGLPADVWLPSNDRISPGLSDQYSLGVTKDYDQFDFELSLFYKKMYNTVLYKDGESFWNTTDFYNRIALANGDAKGAEFSASFRYNKGISRISYTLSKSDRWADEVNEGKKFAFRFDRRHFLNFYGEYEASKKWLFSGIVVLGSGLPTTVPVQKFHLYFDNGTNGAYTNTELYYGSRNNYRIRPYYRADANIIYQSKNRSLAFGAYNIINHRNVIFLSANSSSATEVSFVGIIPYINYGITF